MSLCREGQRLRPDTPPVAAQKSQLMPTRKNSVSSFLVGLLLALGVVGLLMAHRVKPAPLPSAPLHPITAGFGGTPLWRVLNSLFRTGYYHIPHRYDDTVPDIALERPIQVALNTPNFNGALSRVLNEAQPGLYFSVQNGVYVISYDAKRRHFVPQPIPLHPETPVPSNRIRHDTPPDKRLLQRRVALNVTGTDIRLALQSVLKQAKLDYALALPMPFSIRVTKHLRNVPIEAALDTLLAEAHKVDQNLDYRWQGDVLSVCLDNSSYFTEEPRSDPKTVRVDCRFQQAQLHDAVMSVVRGGGGNYTIDPRLKSDSVTLSTSNVTPTGALEAMRRVGGNRMETRFKGNILYVFPKEGTR